MNMRTKERKWISVDTDKTAKEILEEVRKVWNNAQSLIMNGRIVDLNVKMQQPEGCVYVFTYSDDCKPVVGPPSLTQAEREKIKSNYEQSYFDRVDNATQREVKSICPEGFDDVLAINLFMKLGGTVDTVKEFLKTLV